MTRPAAGLLALALIACCSCGGGAVPSVPGAAPAASAASVSAASSARLDWDAVQACGGLRILDGVRLPDGDVLLPVAFDVSGLREVTVAPRTLNSTLVVLDAPVRLEAGRLRLGLVVAVAGATGATSQAPVARPGPLPAGLHPLEFENPDGSTVALPPVRIPIAAQPHWHAALLPGASPEGPCREVAGLSFHAVVLAANTGDLFGHRADATWVPADADVLRAERALSGALVRGLAWGESGVAAREGIAPEWLRRATEEVARDLEEYDIQVAGLVRDGRRHLLVSAYLVGTFGGQRAAACDGWLTVHDGGTGFWRVLVDIETGACTEFEANGEA